MPAFPGTPGDDTLFGSLTEDVMEGFGGNDRLFGGADEDVLDGGDGNDLLDGGAHADTMIGGPGDDYYYTENAGDVLVEGSGAGYDTVFVDGAWTNDVYILPANLERLIALNTSSVVSLYGNELANEIVGNQNANVLYGGSGSGVVDILIGGTGDDTYVLSPYGAPVDLIIEFANEGYDRVQVGNFNYTLPENVERLEGYNASLTGNDLDNTILGGFTASEIIDGRAGADTMIGYGGNDYYVVDNAGDTVVEGPNAGDTGGYDTVFVDGIDYTLPAYVERGVAQDLNGLDAIDLTGNELDNELTGNAGANVLDGKLGRDVLTGNGGADTFAFTTALSASNADQVVGFEVGVDKLALDDAVFAGLAPGALAAGAFNTGSTASEADDRILYDAATGNLYFDADGSGAASSPILFAIVHEGTSLTASDFIVI